MANYLCTYRKSRLRFPFSIFRISLRELSNVPNQQKEKEPKCYAFQFTTSDLNDQHGLVSLL